MLLRQLDLTTALRPSLLPDETLLFVQDGVGLYEGYVNCRPARRALCDDNSSHRLLTASAIENTRSRIIRTATPI